MEHFPALSYARRLEAMMNILRYIALIKGTWTTYEKTLQNLKFFV